MVDMENEPFEVQWMPIETAPKDGTYILLTQKERYYSNGIPFMTGKWNDQKHAKRPEPYWERLGGRGATIDRLIIPTHWMPMFEGPK